VRYPVRVTHLQGLRRSIGAFLLQRNTPYTREKLKCGMWVLGALPIATIIYKEVAVTEFDSPSKIWATAFDDNGDILGMLSIGWRVSVINQSNDEA
jgi:hypothetical protein